MDMKNQHEELQLDPEDEALLDQAWANVAKQDKEPKGKGKRVLKALKVKTFP